MWFYHARRQDKARRRTSPILVLDRLETRELLSASSPSRIAGLHPVPPYKPTVEFAKVQVQPLAAVQKGLILSKVNRNTVLNGYYMLGIKNITWTEKDWIKQAQQEIEDRTGRTNISFQFTESENLHISVLTLGKGWTKSDMNDAIKVFAQSFRSIDLNFKGAVLKAYKSGYLVYELGSDDNAKVMTLADHARPAFDDARTAFKGENSATAHISIATFPKNQFKAVKRLLEKLDGSYKKLKPHPVTVDKVGIYSIDNENLVYKAYKVIPAKVNVR